VKHNKHSSVPITLVSLINSLAAAAAAAASLVQMQTGYRNRPNWYSVLSTFCHPVVYSVAIRHFGTTPKSRYIAAGPNEHATKCDR